MRIDTEEVLDSLLQIYISFNDLKFIRIELKFIRIFN